MKIGIIGINKISKFYAIILAQYSHEVILYESISPFNNLSVDNIILEEKFFNDTIKNLTIFKSINFRKINMSITEKYLFKENSVNESFVEVLDYEYLEDFQFNKIPNIEIVSLNSKSINQIKMMEDILILDTPDPEILQQLDLIKINNWTSIYIEAEKTTDNFQITKQGNYSILGINDKEKLSIFINCATRNRKKVLSIIRKKVNSYKIMDEQDILKYDKYAYKNIAIINTALVEYNYPYRDYSLLLQIIKNTEPKKVFSQLDIYSDIKSNVI